ncbi:hypothetical protein ABIB25_002407 [Nakamurella sp. UYEF19]|uniref:SAV_915 family protein n=1 Tax=Nakamurella sp. UYEF19 TaxID=1756392 RepID=UPI00339566FE
MIALDLVAINDTHQDGIACSMDATPDILFVPIHSTRLADVATIRTALLPSGEPAGLAFTSLVRLASAMGVEQGWTCMSEEVLRSGLLPLGIFRMQVDADFVGRAVSRLNPPALLDPSRRSGVDIRRPLATATPAVA